VSQLAAIRLLRPRHYVKNGFIFLPLFFASQITDTGLLFQAILAFVAFSLTASAIYIFNDIHDVDEDRQHPAKKHRPLAAGAVTKAHAIAIMVFLFASGAALMVFVSPSATLFLLAYVIINIAYSFHLKHLAVIDVTIIAVGFVLRLFVGSAATDIPLSMWIVIMTFLLALFMALAKRRDDVLIYVDSGKKMRTVVDGYSLHYLDTTMAIMASVIIVAYISYTASPDVTDRLHSDYLYVTALFVVMGVMRYLQIALVEKSSGSPTGIFFNDRFMQVTLIAWITTFTWVLY
jgi:decaprenyl-phosphate phosphoribosyltransferase